MGSAWKENLWGHTFLTPFEIEYQKWARDLSERLLRPVADQHSRQKLSTEFLAELSRQGVMSLLIPEERGGGGLSARAFSLVMREISRVCASTGVTVAVTNMIGDLLSRESSDKLKSQYLSQIIAGESLTASFCLTESAAGSDASRLQTRAIKKGDAYEISGEKIYVTNGAFSKIFVVMAKTSDESSSRGISAFLVDRDSEGVVIGGEEDKMGLTGSSTIRMSFDQVSVPASHLILGEGQGFKIAMRALDGGRISVASQALGIAEAALEAGRAYALEREAFGSRLSDFQAIQWKVANAATQLAAAEQLILRAASLKDRGRAFTQEASMAKLFTTEAAFSICDQMLQIHGGYGYIKDYPIERYVRDVRVTTLYEGTSEIQRLVIARGLLQKENRE